MNVFTSSALPPVSETSRGKDLKTASREVRQSGGGSQSNDSVSLKSKNLSEAEIREKIKEMQNKKKNSYGQVSKGQSSVEGTHEGKHPGDLSNDPRDPATRGKLMDALSDGSFPFSQKEREVLGKILEG